MKFHYRIGWSPLVLMALYGVGCASARQTRQADDDFSKLPPVPISASAIVHSPAGDMTAHLPGNWVTIDPEKMEDPQIFAVACDPDYTLSLVFSEVTLDNASRAGLDRNGMRGLLDASFARRQKRTGMRAQEVGDIEEFVIGLRKFGAYTYTTDSMHTVTRVALFYTSYHLYECAITQLTFSEREPLPPKQVRDIHQLVLTTVEW